jgi:hypothetical protein
MKWLTLVQKSCGLMLIMAAIATPAFAGGMHCDVPEIDPGSVGSALALLTGGFLMITERFRRKQ